MLQSVLPPKVYLSEDILALENERIFKSLWIFAGLRSALANRNAFFTRKIGGVPVVVTTDGETIRAFENLCAHRSMPIQQEACGNRALICPYHAWTFNQDGSLRAMARPHLYDLRRAEKENIRLREFSVEIVGNLIFVNLAPEPAPFATQFTPEFMAEIKTASEHFDQVYAYTTFEVGYNWKLNFENVVDYNHVPFIHSASFGSMLPRQEVASPAELPEDVTWDRDEMHRDTPKLADLSFPAVGELVLPPRWFTNLVRRLGDRDVYYNWYIYPNVNFGSVAGETFLIQQYEPLSPGRTRYHLWMTTAQRLLKRQDFTALLRGIMESEKKVVDEDVVFLENLQRNLYEGARPAVHGAYEFQLFRMGRWYRENVIAPN